jgi:1,2-diacylglycerol 3-beta-galactosyltransferase
MSASRRRHKIDGVAQRRVPEVLLVITDAGGGHRAAAQALTAAADGELRLRTLRLQDALGGVDFCRPLLGASMEDTYNEMVRRGRTRYLTPLLRALHLVTSALHGRLVRMLSAWLAGFRPDAIVSLMPNFNAAIRDATRAAHPGTPFLVLMTDFVDYPPHFWIEPGIDRLIVGSARARGQALETGIAAERISVTSGMPLHPRHYAIDPGARASYRREIGVSDDDFLVTILFGGKGSPEIHDLAARLLQSNRRVCIVAVCGDNPPLYARVSELAGGWSARLHALPFTDKVPDILAAGDLLLTKPGPGSLAEAFHHGVPVVVTRNAWTVPQERANAAWVEAEGLGLVARDWREMADVTLGLFDAPERLRALRQRVLSLPANRAVFEALAVIAAEAARSPAM